MRSEVNSDYGLANLLQKCSKSITKKKENPDEGLFYWDAKRMWFLEERYFSSLFATAGDMFDFTTKITQFQV